jgi:hypothetical protein
MHKGKIPGRGDGKLHLKKLDGNGMVFFFFLCLSTLLADIPLPNLAKGYKTKTHSHTI